jgi:hypothetical protein
MVSAVADHFAATGEEDEVVGAVPLLDDVQTFVDLPAECLAAPHEAAQDRFGLSRVVGYPSSRKSKILLEVTLLTNEHEYDYDDSKNPI